MRVKVRGYEGILVELSSEIMTDLYDQSIVFAEYCVDTTVEPCLISTPTLKSLTFSPEAPDGGSPSQDKVHSSKGAFVEVVFLLIPQFIALITAVLI